MNYVIWKFTLDQAISHWPLPSTAEFLKCGVQSGEIVLWTKTNPSHAVTGGRTIRVIMTGEPISEDDDRRLFYIDTVQLPTGIVAHIFEVV